MAVTALRKTVRTDEIPPFQRIGSGVLFEMYRTKEVRYSMSKMDARK